MSDQLHAPATLPPGERATGTHRIGGCVGRRAGLDTVKTLGNLTTIGRPCRPLSSHCKGKGKGKVLPRTGHEDPEGEQVYSSTLPSTSALDGGGWSMPRPGRFTPRKDPVLIV